MGLNVNLKRIDTEGHRPKRMPQALKVIQARSFLQSEGIAVPTIGSIQTLRGMKMVGVKCVGLMHFEVLIPAATYQLIEQLDQIPNRVHPEMHFGIAPCSQSQNDDDTHTYYVAVEVSDFQGVPENLVHIEIPETKYAVVKKDLGKHVGDLYSDSWEYLDTQKLKKMQTHEPPMAFQLEVFHESLEDYRDRIVGHPETEFEMDLCVPIEIPPESYKPERVPAALKVYAVGTTSSHKGEIGMELVKSPIDNVVGNVFIHVTDLCRSAEWYSMVMGLPLLEERLNGGNVYWMELQGGTGIILDDNGSNTPETPRVRFMYNTSNIEDAYRFLDNQGVQPLYPIERPHPGLALLMFTDPDGNSLMVTQSDYTSDVVDRLEDTESPILNWIGGIFLNVTDMNRAIRFHSEVLGLPYHEVGPGQENSIYGLQMKSGTGVLLDDNRFRHGDEYETLFMLVSPDVDGSKVFLESKGVPVFTDIERHGEMAFFTVKDPDGNVIMICSET
jgi:predicted enzyme related to lactoylglutathione lyase/predicted transcriptional regulator YdeE